jgi:hypothetical protein
MTIDKIQETIYEETFSTMYNTLISDYKEGTITVEELEKNVEEQHQIMLNALYEGETKFAYTSAVVDAHQYALAIIKKELA